MPGSHLQRFWFNRPGVQPGHQDIWNLFWWFYCGARVESHCIKGCQAGQWCCQIPGLESSFWQQVEEQSETRASLEAIAIFQVRDDVGLTKAAVVGLESKGQFWEMFRMLNWKNLDDWLAVWTKREGRIKTDSQINLTITHCWWGCKMTYSFWKIVRQFLKSLNIDHHITQKFYF